MSGERISRRKLSVPILLAVAGFALLMYAPITGSREHRTLIWDSQTSQWKNACVPVRLVPLWECVPPEAWQKSSWNDALKLLYSGQADSFMQFHSLTVILVLKSGIIVSTREPTIDQIFTEIKKCGDACKAIGWGTE